jgi:hypothetical protein
MTNHWYDVWEARKGMKGTPLPLTDAEGKLTLKKALIPIRLKPEVPGMVGHWILVEMRLAKKEITIYDWLDRPLYDKNEIGAKCGRWWDDMTRIHNGLSWDAQGWAVKIERPSMQMNAYDCGVHMLAHISRLTGANTKDGIPISDDKSSGNEHTVDHCWRHPGGLPTPSTT